LRSSVSEKAQFVTALGISIVMEHAKVSGNGRNSFMREFLPQPECHNICVVSAAARFASRLFCCHALPYPNSVNGIQGVSFKFKCGSLTVITGCIRSGKTTLCRILLGLLLMESGKIRWNGEIVADPADFFIPPRCTRTAQVPLLFGNTL
jgi:ABC-type transport system involved in cytochrome bd biosynthesis fused ATPase/permease subunit